MKILLIAAVVITLLAGSGNQVASDASLNSADETNSNELSENDFLNLRRSYKPYYHHNPYHHYPHYTPIYPPQYIPSYQPPPYQPPPYQPGPYQPPQYQPSQYPPQLPPVYPPQNPSGMNSDCHICRNLVTYINQYGGSTVFSRNSALQNACNVVGTANLAGCQHFVAIHGANLIHYLHPQSDPIGTCQLIHVC